MKICFFVVCVWKTFLGKPIIVMKLLYLPFFVFFWIFALCNRTYFHMKIIKKYEYMNIRILVSSTCLYVPSNKTSKLANGAGVLSLNLVNKRRWMTRNWWARWERSSLNRNLFCLCCKNNEKQRRLFMVGAIFKINYVRKLYKKLKSKIKDIGLGAVTAKHKKLNHMQRNSSETEEEKKSLKFRKIITLYQKF